MAKMINNCGLMFAIAEWNGVMDSAQPAYDAVRSEAGSQANRWPANVFDAARRLPIGFHDQLVARTAEMAHVSGPVVDRVFRQPFRLSLDTRFFELVGGNMPHITPGAFVDQVTLRHCLTHTTRIDWRRVPNPYHDPTDEGMNWTAAGKNWSYLQAILMQPHFGDLYYS